MNAHGHNISAQSPAAVLPPMIAALLSGTQGQVYLSSVLNEEEWTDDGSDERHVVGRNPKNLIRFIHKWDKPGRSVFFCIGTIQKSKARRIKENIEAMAFASSDVDLKDLGLTRDEALAAINTLKLPPTVIVWSGHGFHLYWLLGAPCLEPGRIEAVNALICETVAGDRAPNHRAALLRVPGTTNSKGGGSEPCEVIRDGGERYTLEQLEAWDQEPVLTRKSAPADAGSNPFLEAAKRLAFKAPIDVQARLAAMEFKGDGDTSIHSTQLSVTAALTIAGWAEDDVVEAVLEATKAAVPGRNWNWVAEEKAIRKMCRDAAEKVESGELGANKTDREPARPNETNDGAPKPKGKAKKTGEFEFVGRDRASELRLALEALASQGRAPPHCGRNRSREDDHRFVVGGDPYERRPVAGREQGGERTGALLVGRRLGQQDADPEVHGDGRRPQPHRRDQRRRGR